MEAVISTKNLRDSRSELTYGSVGVNTMGVNAPVKLSQDEVSLSACVVVTDKALRVSEAGDSDNVSSEGGLLSPRLLGVAG